jgi:hypothetical protein
MISRPALFSRPAMHQDSGRLSLVVQTLVDLCNLGDPTLAFGMLQRQDFLVRPVKVIRDVRYLLVEPL